MNKAELIKAISKQTGETKVSTGRNLDTVLQAIADSLKSGNNVTLVGFGTFRVVHRAARKGVNPLTKASITIEAAKVPRFFSGQALKKAVAAG